VDENGELGRISQEEDGRVVEDPVMVALLSVELDGEATRVSRGVRGSLLSANSRESNERPRLLPDLREKVRRCELRNVVGDLELSERTSALRVNNTAEASGSTHSRDEHLQLTALVFARGRSVPEGRSSGNPATAEDRPRRHAGRRAGS
jgi:hypothetical protein